MSEMPDAETCPKTPCDRHGKLISAGRYGEPTHTGYQRVVEVIDDVDSGTMVYRTKGAEQWTPIGISDPSAWRKLERLQ